MRFPTAVVIALLTLLSVACNQVPSPTTPAAQLGAEVVAGLSRGDEVPFKGTLEGRLTVSTPIEPPLLSNLNEATGTASHLGRFTLKIPTHHSSTSLGSSVLSTTIRT